MSWGPTGGQQTDLQLKGPLKQPMLCAVFTSSVGNEFAVAVVVLALYPLLIEATKNTQGHDKVRI